jgi:hypothetical protein
MPTPSSPMREAARADKSIVSLRSAVILLLSVVTGCATGALTYAGNHPLAEAVLAGLTAAGAAVWWFDRFIS